MHLVQPLFLSDLHLAPLVSPPALLLHTLLRKSSLLHHLNTSYSSLDITTALLPTLLLSISCLLCCGATFSLTHCAKILASMLHWHYPPFTWWCITPIHTPVSDPLAMAHLNTSNLTTPYIVLSSSRCSTTSLITHRTSTYAASSGAVQRTNGL